MALQGIDSLADADRPASTITLRQTTRAVADDAELSGAAIDAFTVALGGRECLLETLQIADGSPDIAQITRLLLDPRYGGWSLRRLCGLAHVTIADLFIAYRKALLVRAHLQATKIVTDSLVHVVEDVMRRSQPHAVPCSACAGQGTLDEAGAACRPCRGTGQVIQAPDLDRQKLALELGQLSLKGGGINLTQTTVVAPTTSGGFGPGALDQLQQAVAQVLAPRTRAPLPPIDTLPLATEESPYEVPHELSPP